MRRIRITLALFITIFIMAFSVSVSTIETQAASNTSLITSYLKYFKKGQYKKARKYIRRMKNNDKDTSLKKMTQKQKNAYYKVLKRYENKYSLSSNGKTVWGYYLADLNKDRKPELLIEYGGSEADAKTAVYTYKKQKAKKVGSVFSGNTGYIAYPRKGLLSVYANMGYCTVSVITMKKGKLKIKKYGSQETTGEYCIPTNYLDSHKRYGVYSSYLDYSDLQ